MKFLHVDETNQSIDNEIKISFHNGRLKGNNQVERIYYLMLFCGHYSVHLLSNVKQEGRGGYEDRH